MKAQADHKKFAASVYVLTTGILTTAIGLFALSGWIFGHPLLASYFHHLKPMAPSSGALFCLLGTILIFYYFLPQNKRVILVGKTIGFFCAITTLLILIFSLMEIRFPIEHLGLSIGVTLGETPLGYMSSVTAFCFILIGVSLLITFSSTKKQTGWYRIVFVLSGLVILVSFLFLLAYLYGAPLMYGGRNNPPSLPTSFALLILGINFLILSGQRFRFREAGSASSARVSMILIPVFMVLATVIIATGYFYYQNYEKHFRAEAEHQLSAIADLKVHDLVQWRKERLGDASVFYGNDNFSVRVERLFEAPNDRENKERVRIWMRQVRDAYDYNRIYLHDVRGVERLSVPDMPIEPDSVFLHCASEAFESGQVIFQEFYRSEQDGRIYLSVLTPILDTSRQNRVIGVLTLRIDPEHYLYPLIMRWPTPSRTAETLLIRREGNEVVFLNDLRFQKNAALDLRFSLENSDLPAAKAALGQEGIVEGSDYRGIPVIADIRSIPDSPWFIVAKMDKSEVYAPLRERLWVMVVLVGVFLVGTGAGLGAIWRSQSLRFYRERFQTSERLRVLSLRQEAILAAVPDIIMEVNNDKVYTWANRAGLAFFGDDVIGREASYYFEGEQETYDTVKPLFNGNEDLIYIESWQRRRDGEKRLLAWWCRVVKDGADHVTGALSTARDITETKRAAEVLRESEERYRTFFNTSRDCVFITSKEGRWVDMNDAAFELFGYSSQDELMQIKIPDLYANSKDRAKHIAAITVQGYSRDYPVDLRKKDGRVIHTLITSTVRYDTDGNPIGFMGTIKDITERKRAEESLHDSERKYRTLVENIPQKIFTKDKKSVYVTCNANYARDLNIVPEDIVGKNDYDFYPEELANKYRVDDKRVMKLGTTEEIEEKYLQDGREVWIQTLKTPIRDERGKVVGIQGIFWDITERKRAEEVIKNTTMRLKEAQRIANVGSWELNLTTNVLTWSDEIYRMFEIDPERNRPSYEAFLDAIHPDDREKVNAAYNDSLKKQTPYTIEHRLLFPDGRIKFVHEQCETVFENDKPVRSIGTVQDITERKRAEEAVTTARAFLDRVVEMSPFAMWISDKEGTLLRTNQSLRQTINLTDDQIVGKYNVFHDVNLEMQGVMPLVRDVFEKHVLARFSIPWKAGDAGDVDFRGGRDMYIDVSMFPILNPQGELINVVCQWVDITERKRAEEALRESEDKFRTLFENMTEGVALHELVYDESGKAVDYKLLDVNPSYEKHTGISIEKVRGSLASEMYGTGNPPYMKEYIKVAQHGKSFVFETYFPPLNKHFRISAFSPKPGQFATVFEDITEQKQREGELRQKTAEMERFTYTISHDLKSPLVTIKTFLGYLEQDRSASDTGRVEQDMFYIRSAADKMGLLLDELLEMSRIGRVVNPPVTVSFSDLVNEALAAVAGRIAEQHVEISVSRKEFTLYGDRLRLAELWQNLIENAVKFMGDQPSPRIEIGIEKQKEGPVFFVRDNGMGIDARYHEKIFGLFEKLDKQSEGTGLGLALIKRIVELYKGKIWLESEGIGKGTCFRFTLPEAVKK